MGNKKFIIPTSRANDCDPLTGIPSIMVQNNAKKTFVPCGVETSIDADVFATLKDAGIITPEENYEVNSFDPIKDDKR